ncbi:MAG: hypothetical protein AAGI38_24805, partial [Bacteroidota bacterium]
MRIVCCLLLLVSNFSLSAQTVELYGLNFSKNNELRVSKVDASTGNVSYLNTQPASNGTFLTGVSDFDPIGQRYFYVAGANQLVTYNLDSNKVVSRPIVANPNSAVTPITNMAYNWLNDTLYGLEYKTGSLRLVSVDPDNGNFNMISPGPISPDGFSQGDADIDPVGRRFLYVRRNTHYTGSLDNGQAIHQPSVKLPDPKAFFVNIAYNWLNDTIYGLYFLPGAFASNPWCTGGLFLASVDPVTGNMNVISKTPTSPDCFQGGVSDIDPMLGQYYYVRDNKLYVVDLADGSVISSQSLVDPGNSIMPITNIAINEAARAAGTNIRMKMGADTLWINPGESVDLNAF